VYQPDTPALRQHLRGTRRSFLGATLGASAALLLSACRIAAPVNPTATPAAKVPPPDVASPVARPPAASPAIVAVRPIAKPVDFPIKPLELLVPFNPGGGYDAVARQLANPLQTAFGQPVVVKNVPGGGQRIAARQFQHSEADGYTLIYASDTTLLTDVLITPAEGFDLSSWIWVSGVRKSPAFVAVPKSSSWWTIQDVLDADRRGTRIRMGHNGVGGFLPLQVALTSALGIKNASFVGGFTGTADITPSLVRGDLDLQVFSPVSSTIQFVKSDEMRAILSLEAQRSPLLPEIPTARELNLPNVDDLEITGTALSGIAVPPATPKDRVDYLGAMVMTALRDPGFMAWARESGVEADLQLASGSEFTEMKQQEYEVWRRYESPMREALQ
jgi:tripartite-type tricarboxylate transporter receptor subunit TctC